MMETRPEIIGNVLFRALDKIGHKPEEDVYIWSQGLATHYQNLLRVLSEKTSADETRAILSDVWDFVAAAGQGRISRTLGLEVGIDRGELGILTRAIANDATHPAILAMGDSVEEAILNWVRAFALFDFAIYTQMEKHIGSRRTMDIFMDLWESFALSALEHVKRAVGVTGPDDIDMDKVGEISQIYWETIACPYRVTRHTPEVHEAELEACPYYANMIDVLGEEQTHSMTHKCQAAASINYYDVILRALGVADKYRFTMDKFICGGDDVDRLRFEKRA
jgi:hypothetical protein